MTPPNRVLTLVAMALLAATLSCESQSTLKIDVTGVRAFNGVTLVLKIEGHEGKVWSGVSVGTSAATAYKAGLIVSADLKGAVVLQAQALQDACVVGTATVAITDVKKAESTGAVNVRLLGVDNCTTNMDAGPDAADAGVDLPVTGTGGAAPGTGGAGGAATATGGAGGTIVPGTGGMVMSGTGGIGSGGAGGDIGGGTGGVATGGAGGANTGGAHSGGAGGKGGAPGTGGRGGAGAVGGTAGGPAGGKGGAGMAGAGGGSAAAGAGGQATGGGGAGKGGAGAAGGTSCAAAGSSGSGTSGSGDPSTCISLISDQCAFAAATSDLTFTVEDFKRDASGATLAPPFFGAIEGDSYYRHDAVTFESYGVNVDPGTTSTIVAGAVDAVEPSGTRGSIMSATASTARDAIIATFSTAVKAATFDPHDDDGKQTWTVLVGTPDGDVTFALPSAQQPFVGLVSRCGAKITSVRIVPPMPSGWWRLQSVTFAP